MRRAVMVRLSCFKAALLFLFILISGCSAPLTLEYRPKENPEKIKEPVSILVEPFADQRPDKTRVIGSINATVADMSGDKLVITNDPASLVEDAFRKELVASGFRVVSTDPDFILRGELKELRLDIGARDVVRVEVSSRLIEKETGRELWSGTESEKSDRYAGVMGNSSSTISKYLLGSLSKVVTKTISQFSPTITNTKAAYRTEAPPAAPVAPAAGTGRIVVTSDPPRAKVYINEVYYGLTPLQLDVEPGIYELSIKQKGFKNGKEKVSVRAGQFTELEMVMEKE